jgi:LL-diaminopimelate aminotransferase
MNERLLALRPYPMARLNAVKDELRRRGVPVFDFGTGDPIEPTDPRIRTACTAAVPEVSQYPRTRGGAGLRRAFADWFRGRFGVGLDPDSEVLPAQGSKEAIFHLPLVLIDPARSPRAVLYPVPGYPVYEIGTLFAHAEPIELQLTAANGYLMDPDAVGKEVLARCALVWLCYPHNPTGADLPETLWKKWLRAREQHGFVLASDECYTELYFGARPRSLLQFGRKQCLVFHSLSKRSGMTGYRSAIVAGDAELVQTYARFREGMGVAMPVWTEAASTAAWQDEAHVTARREAFARKREVFLRFFAAAGLTVWPATSTFYLWVRVPAGHSDSSYTEALLQRGIVVSPGSFFGPGNQDWIRLALVPDRQGCEAAIAAWPRPEPGGG